MTRSCGFTAGWHYGDSGRCYGAGLSPNNQVRHLEPPPRMTLRLIAISSIALSLSLSAQAERAFEMLRERDFRQAYFATLGELKAERWLAELPGPSSGGTDELVDGVQFVFTDSCKPHDCDEENLVIAYARTKKKAYILVKTKGVLRTLGEPSPSIAAALGCAYEGRFKK